MEFQWNFDYLNWFEIEQTYYKHYSTRYKTYPDLCLVGNCATSEVILIVIVLYFLIPPTKYYADVITHVNQRKNQYKP